jgi:hypothetical protein
VCDRCPPSRFAVLNFCEGSQRGQRLLDKRSRGPGIDLITTLIRSHSKQHRFSSGWDWMSMGDPCMTEERCRTGELA